MLFRYFLILAACTFLFCTAAPSSQNLSKQEKIKQYIDSHMLDSDTWYPFGHAVPWSITFPTWIKYEFTAAPLDMMVAKLDNKIDLSPSLHVFMILLASAIMILLFIVLYKKRDPLEAPTGITNFLEILVLFVRNEIVIRFLGEKDGRKYAPIFLTLFFMLFFLNYLSLLPGLSTATANLSVTLAFSAITLSGMLLGGLFYHGPLGFFKIFMPPGIPIFFFPITLFIVLIEMLGLIIKPFALTVRLFANMLAGHLVLFSILGLILLSASMTGLLYSLLALFIYMLELLVAFIQAYIFTMLSALFVGSMLHPSH